MFESESLRNFVGHTKSHYEGLVKGENQRIVNQALVKHSKRPSSSSYQCAKIWKSYLRHVWMPLALKTQNDSSHLCMELKQKCFADLKSVSKDVMCSYSQSSSYDLDEITEFSMLYLHKSFAKLEKHSISLEIALLECQEQLKNDTVYKEKASNVFWKERKSVDTKFDKPSVVRQPNAQRIPKPSVLGKSAPSAQNNVSRPLLRSNQMKDKVVPNTGHVKFKRQDSRRKPNPWILIVQLILFIVDFGCTKHMTGNLSLLCNFMEKYLGTVRFGNDQFVPILGYGDLVQGNITIKRVYYIEGLNHNLFSVGQFCDADLEVAFQKSTCFVRDLQGNNLLTGNHGTDLYTISLQEITSSAPSVYVKHPPLSMVMASKTFHLKLYLHQLVFKEECELDTIVPSQQELDLLFGPLYDEFFNDGTSRVNKSSSPTDNSAPQDTHPSTNIHPTSEPTTQTNVHAEENNDNQAEFTNPFCTLVQEIAESSSPNIGNSNVHTFNQPQHSEYRWTKDHRYSSS
ncbi:hypothetical protein Tco_1504072 [Tanacetum coccineum]